MNIKWTHFFEPQFGPHCMQLSVCMCMHLRHYFFHTELVHALLCCGRTNTRVSAFSFPQVQLWLSSIVNDVTSWRGCNQRAARNPHRLPRVYMQCTCIRRARRRRCLHKMHTRLRRKFAYKSWGRETACTHPPPRCILAAAAMPNFYLYSKARRVHRGCIKAMHFQEGVLYVVEADGRRFDKSATRLLWRALS